MTAGAPAPKHRLLLELGRGGMGVVYLARVERDGASELVVVKQLKADLAKDPEFRQMLIEEARIATRLSHPNVVRTYEAGFDGRHHFIAMELLDGQPLDAILRAPTQSLPLPLAVYVLECVLAGLHAAHELKDADGKPLDVVHRDVSPHNVLVTYDGDVKVLDFGIAKAADSSQRTRTGVVKGKATYMAPEQAARARIDRRADVFAVGVMLWEVLTRGRFWGDLSEQEILVRLQRGEIDRDAARAKDVPPALVAICARATAASAADRYATANEMRDALVEWSRDASDAGREELARFVSNAFASDRAQLASEIASVTDRDDPIEPVDEDDVPVRGFSRTYALKLGSEGGTPPSRSAATGVARRWSRTTIALFVALGIGGTVAATIAMRKTTPTAQAPASATSNGKCVTNADCAATHRDEPFVCRASDGQCVALESVDCTVHAQPGDAVNAATIWIGTMFPLSGPDAARFGVASTNAADLARREVAEVAHGLPSTNGARRPIAIVACDDAIDAARAARHLLDDVRVAAIIGVGSGDGGDAAALVRERRVVGIRQARPPFAAVVRDLFEPRIRAMPARSHKGDFVRVALLRADTPRERSLANAIATEIVVNGTRAVDAPETFHDFAYAESSDASTPSYAPLVAALAAFAPDIVLTLGDPMVKTIVAPLEAAWPIARARPFYVASAPWHGEDFARFVGESAERRRRFFAVVPPTSTPSNARFVIRYNEAFSPKVTRASSPSAPYDAFYVLAFASAVEDPATTDASMTHGLARLSGPGRALDVGPSAIFDALDAVQHGATLDLIGASGPLRFDSASGEMLQNFVVTCIAAGTDGNAGDAIESGIVVDATTKRAQGILKCP